LVITRLNFLLTTLLITFIVMYWHGYQFGHNDQVDTLPYILYLNDNSLFKNDLFIQSLSLHEPNERTAFVYLMLPFVNHLEIATLVFHIFFLALLVAGLLRIAQLFIRNKMIAASVVVLGLSVGYLITLGSADLYFNTFQGGNIVYAIGAWAIYFFLTKRFKRSAILLAVASPLQIIVGLDTFLLLSAVLFFDSFLSSILEKRKIELKVFFQFAAIYSCTAGLFFLAVAFNKQQSDCNMSDKEFFDLILDFRNTHHYLIAYFSLKKSLLFIALSFIGLMASYRVHKVLFKLLIAGIAIVSLYTIITELTHSVPVASFQFYILTAWMKIFALVAIFATVSMVLPRISVKPITTLFILSVVILITSTGLVTMQFVRKDIPYEFGSNYKTTNAEIDICIRAKSLSDKNALFIHPFEFSALKYFGQRSAYAEFKAGLHQKCGAREWYDRLQEVYGINLSMKEKGFALKEIANEHLLKLSSAEWNTLKLKGATHAILPVHENPNFDDAKQLESNSDFTIWKL